MSEKIVELKEIASKSEPKKLVQGRSPRRTAGGRGRSVPTEARYQQRTVHFYRNLFSATPPSNIKLAATGELLEALLSGTSYLL